MHESHTVSGMSLYGIKKRNILRGRMRTRNWDSPIRSKRLNRYPTNLQGRIHLLLMTSCLVQRISSSDINTPNAHTLALDAGESDRKTDGKLKGCKIASVPRRSNNHRDLSNLSCLGNTTQLHAIPILMPDVPQHLSVHSKTPEIKMLLHSTPRFLSVCCISYSYSCSTISSSPYSNSGPPTLPKHK